MPLRGGGVRGHGGREGAGRSTVAVRTDQTAKKKVDYSNAWQEARTLIVARRGRLALGLALMLVNRLAGLILPATSKYLIDDVIGKRRADLLVPLALAAGAATMVQAVTSFALSQVLGVAAQRSRGRAVRHAARAAIEAAIVECFCRTWENPRSCLPVSAKTLPQSSFVTPRRAANGRC